MIFNVKDIEQFQTQKQFIDTAIVPLIQVNLVEDGLKQSSSAVDYLMTLTMFIEQQFRGRIMLMPPFSYTDRTKNELLPMQLQEELHSAGFKSVIFITCDHFWTKEKENLDILWLPAIPLESMDKTVKQRILEDQLKQIIPVLTKVWA
ncbi:MAG: YpiF family protein [Solibacillus sp.]